MPVWLQERPHAARRTAGMTEWSPGRFVPPESRPRGSYGTRPLLVPRLPRVEREADLPRHDDVEVKRRIQRRDTLATLAGHVHRRRAELAGRGHRAACAVG